MKPALALVVCPQCKSEFSDRGEKIWKCSACGYMVEIQDSTLIFSSRPAEIQPFEKRERGAGKGTPWRQANWRFLDKQVDVLSKDAVILDVGAGHGDFAEIFDRRECLYLDVVPYPEIDLACDLTERIPFRKDCLDAIALINVLEHVYKAGELMAAVAEILKPGGVLWITVPFLLKIHQEPYDFFRFTSHALERMGSGAGLKLEKIEEFYDPIFLVGESLRNIEYRVLPGMKRFKRYMTRGILTLTRIPVYLLKSQIGKSLAKGLTFPADPAPVGYQLVFRKPGN